ncbi:MAG: glycosyltransferase [Desulfobacteraceae bacterium]|nr:glycosyltransferase [Desulfobacteraceae bacterium]
MPPASPHDPWSFFDQIYCINCKERPDRRAQAEAQFAGVGLAGKVIFWTAERHPTDCEQGIYESHLACIRRALAEGARSVLVFEDDVVFEGYLPQRLAAAGDFLSLHPDWQIIFLGCMMKKSRATETSAVRSIRYRCLAHAYALNRKCAEQLARTSWCKIPLDAMLSRFDQGVYACYPTFAFQSDSVSDNHRHRRLDAFRRWCGGLRRIQKINEWWHVHSNLLVILHLIALGVLLWMVL